MPGWVYLVTQSNKQQSNPSKNPFVPTYAEVTVTRFEQNKLLKIKTMFDQKEPMFDFPQMVAERQHQTCLIDYVPGSVIKLAFDQPNNTRLAVAYRILTDTGYKQRLRVYNLTRLSCSNTISEKEAEMILFEASMRESQFLNDSFKSKSKSIFLDQALNQTGAVSAMTLSDTLLISFSPDLFTFREYTQIHTSFVPLRTGPLTNRISNQIFHPIALFTLKPKPSDQFLVQISIVGNTTNEQHL